MRNLHAFFYAIVTLSGSRINKVSLSRLIGFNMLLISYLRKNY